MWGCKQKELNLKSKTYKTMTLIRYKSNPNDLWFPSFSNLLDDFLGNEVNGSGAKAGATLPAVNIKENKDEFQVELAAPGMSKKDFHIEVEDDVLKVSSKKEEKHEEKAEDGAYSRKEFSYHSFRRAFALPKTVAADKIKASYTNGILTLSIPKKEEAKEKPARTIAVS
jgi:HSP20 family protein